MSAWRIIATVMDGDTAELGEVSIVVASDGAVADRIVAPLATLLAYEV